jgi:predicted Zn-dependent protease
MNEYFSLLNNYIFSELSKNEVLITNISGENSQFIRFNNSKVRQTGLIDDMSFSMILISNNRKSSISLTLTGNIDNDKSLILFNLNQLRDNVKFLPEDPFIVMPTVVKSSSEIYSGSLLNNKDSVNNLIPAMQGVDLTGIWASGKIFSGNANSMGLEHWFETETFSLDYSIINDEQKMVKACYAGTHWNQKEYEDFLFASKQKMELMSKKSISIEPGEYRAYIAPDGVSDLIGMLSWGGIGESSIQQGDSSLIKLKNLESKLSPCFNLSEDFSSGMVPRFNGMGEVAPEKLPLIVAGALKNTLVSSRTEKEYNIPTNYASSDEGLRSPIMNSGKINENDVLKNIEKGVYLSNLHYLNWSDRIGGRITGMTRYACFWVEDGEIVAPIENMRFDDTIYNIFGQNLEESTDKLHLVPNVGTYDGRNLGGTYCPGIILSSFALTL